MDDVEAHVAGPRVAHHRVEVGAVVVERPAGLVDQAGDLGDVLVEEAERVGVGQHQAGDVVVDLGPQVVHLDAAALVGRDLDHLVAGHRHRGRVGAVRGVGRQHLGPRLAAVGVVGAGQQQAGELAVRAGRGLQADVGQAADLGQDSCSSHISSSAPWARRRVLRRVQAGVAGQRRDPLVEPRVVLHRAGAERVEAACRGRSCAARGGCSGGRSPARRPRAARGGSARSRFAGISSSSGVSGHFGLGQRRGAAPGLRLLEDRLARVRAASASRSRHHADPSVALCSAMRTKAPRSAATAAPSASARSSICARVRRSVIATSRPSSCSGYSRPSG